MKIGSFILMDFVQIWPGFPIHGPLSKSKWAALDRSMDNGWAVVRIFFEHKKPSCVSSSGLELYSSMKGYVVSADQDTHGQNMERQEYFCYTFPMKNVFVSHSKNDCEAFLLLTLEMIQSNPLKVAGTLGSFRCAVLSFQEIVRSN